MKLSDYCRRRIDRKAAIADACSVSIGAVTHWCNGTRKVLAEHCVEIERATNGAVTRYDLRPDVFGSPPDEAAAPEPPAPHKSSRFAIRMEAACNER